MTAVLSQGSEEMCYEMANDLDDANRPITNGSSQNVFYNQVSEPKANRKYQNLVLSKYH